MRATLETSLLNKISKLAASFAASCLFVSTFAGCNLSSEKIEFRKGEEAVLDGSHEKAFGHFKNVVDRHQKSPLAIKAAKEAARIAHYELKKFPAAIGYYQHVILYSSSQDDRIEAQKKIADLLFTQTLNYAQAVAEYNRLLELPHTPEDEAEYRLAIARSYFYLNNFYQSQIEIDRLLETSKTKNKDLVFDALLLKANIFLTTKKYDEAIQVLTKLMTDHPVRAKSETIGLVLAICYEEQKNFAKAIEILESIKADYPRPTFLAEKIKALKERQSYLPGARGFRK